MRRNVQQRSEAEARIFACRDMGLPFEVLASLGNAGCATTAVHGWIEGRFERKYITPLMAGNERCRPEMRRRKRNEHKELVCVHKLLEERKEQGCEIPDGWKGLLQ